MKRVSSTSKGMTGISQKGNPAVPSLMNPSKKDDFKPIPNLNNFIKSHVVSELSSRKAGIYKLRKSRIVDTHDQTQFILIYKLGNTKYKIYSYTAIMGKDKIRHHVSEGSVKLSKGLFNTKEFKLNELSPNIVDSINKNITKFNEQYKESFLNKEAKIKVDIVKKRTKFFERLDT